MTNQLERADYIVGLYRIIMNDSNINSNTKNKKILLFGNSAKQMEDHFKELKSGVKKKLK